MTKKVYFRQIQAGMKSDVKNKLRNLINIPRLDLRGFTSKKKKVK